MSAASEWDTPHALEEVGAAFSGGFWGFKLGKGDSGRRRQGMLRGPCPPPASGNWAGRSWKDFITRGGWDRALPALGTSESLGCRRVQAGPIDSMGQDKDPDLGVKATGCSLGTLLLWGPWKMLSAWHGAGWHQGPSREPQLSTSRYQKTPGAMLLPGWPHHAQAPSSRLRAPPRSEHCPFCCPHRRFCTD